MTEEHKRKIQEGRKKAREEKLACGLPVRQSKKNKSSFVKFINDKPILVIDGNEETAFDFWPKIRQVLRPLHMYDLCKKIERELVSSLSWKNIEITKETLSKYFTLEEKANTKNIIKKQRKKSSYKMTEEHKRKIQEGRMKNKGVSI